MRGHFMRLAWVQTALRIRARASGIGALLNTIPEAILGSSIPQVTVVHDLLPLFFPAEYPRQQYYFRSLVPRVLRSSRVVVADSENTRRDIIQSYGIAPEKVRVIYPGYDPTTYSTGDADRLPDSAAHSYLLYVGNLLPHKNLLSLLDALAILRRRRPARLIIRGEGQVAYARAVRERVETLGLRDAVTFQTYADGAALRDLYARAACLVLPSLHEGFRPARPGGHGLRDPRHHLDDLLPSRGRWRRRAPGRSLRHHRPRRTRCTRCWRTGICARISASAA